MTAMFTPSAKTILLAAVLACASPFMALAAAQQLPQVQEQPARPEESSHGPHPLHEIDNAMINLPLAAVLGAALALRPKRRGTPPRTPAVVQTQIMLAVVGAVIMLVVGASLARAFGIVGAASLIRYRSKIDDPKDAGVMLCCLAVGLASGVGLYGLAVFAAAFLVAALAIIESFEPRDVTPFELQATGVDDAAALRPHFEEVLRRFKVDYSLRTQSQDALSYEVKVPYGLATDRVTNAILKLDPKGKIAVGWEQKKAK
jgi:uncharacterized membrane protein YhiD involved in acid resistance